MGYHVTDRGYCKSDITDWPMNKLQEVIGRYQITYREQEQQWLSKHSADLDCSDRNFWKKLHHLTNGKPCHEVIQPLKDNSGTYQFEDDKIAEMLEEVHVFRSHADTSDFDDQWLHQVETSVHEHRISENDSLDNTDSTETARYNADISLEEVKHALRHVKSDSAPGPDGVLPIFLKKAGNYLPECLRALFQSLWEKGCVPATYKKDNRIYIPKPAKPSYHEEKAYRSLSLNSVVGKVYERIIALRYINFIEDTYAIDQSQYAYLRGRNTTQAILTLVQQARAGFRENESTVTALVDLEGAFDGVWRKGLLYKLYSSGIRGRMYMYVTSFLEGRQSRSLVNSVTTEWRDTNVGVPQGSVIAPLLFILNVRHMTDTLPASVKYADDLSGWVTHIDATYAANELQNQLAGVQTWCNKWRLRINPSKTIIMCFNKTGDVTVDVYLNGQKLKQAKQSVVLGTTLDEKLTFVPHIERQTDRAISALNGLSALSFKAQGLRHKVGISLYRSLIRPYLEYAAAAWCTAKGTAINTLLDNAQRHSLLKLTGCLKSTPTESLEIVTGFPPIRLRVQEVAAQEYIRILRKPDSHPLRKLLDPESPPSGNSLSTPADVLKSYTRNLAKRIKLTNLEKEKINNPQDLGSEVLKNRVLKWNNLGSSHNRTREQTQEAQRITTGFLNSLDNCAIIAFTDGSALANPGPCGAGAALYLGGPHCNPVQLTRPVSHKSTSYHGELQAVDLALDYITSYVTADLTGPRYISILTDCQSALSAITGPTPDSHAHIIGDIRNKAKNLTRLGHTIEITWIAGHAGLTGNDLADACAKRAAKEASKWDYQMDNSLKSFQEVKCELKSDVLLSWNRAWSRCEKAEFLHSIKPMASLKPVPTPKARGLATKYVRLLTGHTCLPKHMAYMKIPGYDSSLCHCGKEEGDVQHYLLHCMDFAQQRETMIGKIEHAYHLHNIPPALRTLDIKTLLGGAAHKVEVSTAIQQAVLGFLLSTKESI